MAQNIYDNPAFFEGYAQLPRSVQGLDGAPEWPALKSMLPDLNGKRVIDLGCGYGWFCRVARDLGASAVTGVDISEKMLARAAELTDDAHILYQRSDLESLELDESCLDLVYSSLALHYLPELHTLFAKIQRALKPGGSLVFSMEYPIYTCAARQGWLTDDNGERFYEYTPIAAINYGEKVTLVHDKGSITADKLILANNAFASHFGFLRGRLLPGSRGAEVEMLSADFRYVPALQPLPGSHFWYERR
jgi:SAM-dependent methyltransferase